MLTQQQKDNIKFIHEQRKMSVKKDLRRHQKALIMHYLFIKRFEHYDVTTIKNWIKNLKSILKQPDFKDV